MVYGVPLTRSAPLRLERHRRQPSEEDWRSWALSSERPRAIDLFSGAGGLSLGIERAGYRVILAADHSPQSVETHNHNFAGPALNFDLARQSELDRLVDKVDGIDIDLVAGGPPCQPYSRAGRSKIRSLVDDGVRTAVDQRRELWRSFLHVVERVKPRAVLMENVPDMALADDLATVRIMLNRLGELGYETDLRLLDAWRYGVPQHRQRLIVVALRDASAFRWPGHRDTVTVADAISDLPTLQDSTGEREMRYAKPRSRFQEKARNGMRKRRHVVWDHITRAVRADDRIAFQLMTPSTRYSDLPASLRRYRDDIFDDKYKRLDWHALSRSITAHIAKDGYWYIHPGEPRTLSVREAARIQTFPDSFRFAGSRSHAFAQIGNAVPPALAEAVATAILKATESRTAVSSRPSAGGFSTVRTELVQWAISDRARHPWRHPGSAWASAVGLLLGARRPDLADSFLAEFPSPVAMTTVRVRAKLKEAAGRSASAIRRLARAARRWPHPANADDVSKLLRLGPSDRETLSVLVDQEDRILSTSAALRVAARITGTKVDTTRRLSDGRVVLGRIVGSGHLVPQVNAALHALGSEICGPSAPNCAGCPLARLCPSADVVKTTEMVA